MHKRVPNFGYQGIMGYVDPEHITEVDLVPGTIDEAIQEAIEHAESLHLKKWYRTGQGQYWVMNRSDTNGR